MPTAGPSLSEAAAIFLRREACARRVVVLLPLRHRCAKRECSVRRAHMCPSIAPAQCVRCGLRARCGPRHGPSPTQCNVCTPVRPLGKFSGCFHHTSTRQHRRRQVTILVCRCVSLLWPENCASTMENLALPISCIYRYRSKQCVPACDPVCGAAVQFNGCWRLLQEF
jgi:hypothetical protein